MVMPKLEITKERLMDNSWAVSQLLLGHWEESAKNKHLMRLNPNVGEYQLLEDSNQLLSLFARDGDQIVGYSVNIIRPHLHYCELIVAYNDVIYVHPDYRNSPVGLRIIKETEEQCKEAGAKLMIWHAKEDTALEKILRRKDYPVQEIIFSKEL